MVQTYRQTDAVSGRWTGNSGGIDLSAQQIDENFYDLIQSVATLSASIGSTIGISYITLSGNDLTFHMTDHTLQGPFTFPSSVFLDRGTWAPLTAYSVNDTFNINGTLYLVIYPHTSAATFSAGANDGAGHNYYSAMLTVPGSALPTGGAVGMMLKKSDGHDFDVTWGYPVPVGGATGAVLTKSSSLDFAMTWSATSTFDFVSAPPPSPAGVAGQVLETVDGTHTNTRWITPSSGGGGNSSTVTSLGTSGSVSLDPTLGEVFTISPSAAVTLNAASTPAGARVSLEILTVNNSGFLITFGTGFAARGNMSCVKASSVTTAIEFVSDGTQFFEIGRTDHRATIALGTTGLQTMHPDLGDVFTVTPTGDISLNSWDSPPGALVSLVITTSGTTSYNITPGTNCKSQGVLATGTVSGKVFTVTFVGDGTNLNEISRTTAM